MMNRKEISAERAMLEMQKELLREEKARLEVEKELLREERAMLEVQKEPLREEKAMLEMEKKLLREERARLEVQKEPFREERGRFREEQGRLRQEVQERKRVSEKMNSDFSNSLFNLSIFASSALMGYILCRILVPTQTKNVGLGLSIATIIIGIRALYQALFIITEENYKNLD